MPGPSIASAQGLASQCMWGCGMQFRRLSVTIMTGGHGANAPSKIKRSQIQVQQLFLHVCAVACNALRASTLGCEH